MNRLLTASTAFAVVLGTAGLAMAQSTMPSTSSAPGTPSPGMQIPSSPGVQTPSTGSPNAQSPQANMQGQSQPGQTNASAAQIQQAQQELKSKGLYNGPIDGVAGTETQSALAQFQRQNGLPQTAMLDQQTLARLTGDNTGGTPSPTSTGSRY
jgi:peptidoglycan hydrolase-like protein with peptidoglycan-binding domain